MGRRNGKENVEPELKNAFQGMIGFTIERGEKYGNA